MRRELGPGDLAWRCPADWLPDGGWEAVEPAAGIVGQDRAVEAISFGLGMRAAGHNVFVSGLSGTGRLTTITRFLTSLAADRPAPPDVCFVTAFRSPDEPRPLLLAAGAGRRLQEALELMLAELVEHLPAIHRAPELKRRAERSVAELRRRERRLGESIEAEAARHGFAVVQVEDGTATRPDILPLVGGRPVPLEELPSLVEQGQLDEPTGRRLRERYQRLADRLDEILVEIGELRLEGRRRAEAVRREAIQPFLDLVVDRVRRAVDDERATLFLDALRLDLAEHLDAFVPPEGQAADPARRDRWRANLVVANGDRTGLPVVLETEPTAANLFGCVELTQGAAGEVDGSALRIRAGSLLRANGGYLVLNAEDVLADGQLWAALKRSLKYRRVQIPPPDSPAPGATSVRPEPVPLDVKVVLLGDRSVFDWLYRYDGDFPEVFKTLADFDSVMPPTRDNALRILSVLRKVAADEGLPPLDREGMSAMLEQAVARGRWRHRFSSRFSDLADLLRAAAALAVGDGAGRLGRRHVEAAVAAARRRHDLSEERSLEAIAEGLVHLATRGSAVGQVNGLTVHDLGHHRFGRPVRISARVGLGRDGVVNVERQAGLSGPTHDKGVSILTGFLRGVFAQRTPLNMSCSITFEQSYGGVDGDSASSTEVYAILSALARVPLRQDVAVSGSVDQYGVVQAVGGVNEKVDGFFKVCRAEGLTGEQGVMVPAANVGDLHLPGEVVEAVAAGAFHLWAVDSVEDGVELLTGLPAGTWDDASGWPADSVYGRCQRRLEEMNRLLNRAGKEGESASNPGGGNGQPPATT